MRPQPWSYSGLSQFNNCPRQFHTVRVLKLVKEQQGEAQIWGEWVHKQFENRQLHKTPLPETLAEHEPYMKLLENLPGEVQAEQKVALDHTLQPCAFFAPNVWTRGIIDFRKSHRHIAHVVDYKTGKVKPDLKQLALFALYTFYTQPEVTACYTSYYWTQTKEPTTEEFLRGRIPDIWQKFLPDLKQYKQAFDTDTWQPRQSGLCHGWCPVTECEFWKPKRIK